MKIYVFLFVVFGASAFGHSQDISDQELSALITLQIYKFFDRFTQQIVDAGLDPFQIQRAEFNKAIVPSVIEIGAFVDDLNLSGLSKISVDSAGYVPSMQRLAIDLSQSWTNSLNLSIGNSEFELKLFNNIFKAELSGSLIIERFILASLIDFNIEDGLSVRNVVLNFVPGFIKPNLKVKALGKDYSEAVNKYLGETLLDYLDDNRDEIDNILAAIAKVALNELLKPISTAMLIK